MHPHSVHFPFKRIDWIGCYFAFIISVGLLIVSELIPDWGYWYSSHLVQWQQTEALIHGHLALSDSPGNLEHDECWSGGGVQQVWGLGVSFWRLPFELLARACGHDAFPDRIALGVGVFFVAFLVFKTFARQNVLNRPVKQITLVGLLSCCFIVLFPPFVGLFFSRMAVYEEVAVYAYLYGIILMLSLTHFVRQPTLRRWVLLCFLSGVGPFLRPTLTFYGVVTVFVAWLCLHFKSLTNTPVKWCQLPNCRWWFGPSVFVLGGLLLFFTNQQRFGNGLEFGHRLNLQTGESLFGSMYATRFDHPYEQEPIISASKELFGALFLDHEFNGYDWYQKDIFPGQSHTVRWREFYLCTYDLSYFLLIVSGLVFGLFSLKNKKDQDFPYKPEIKCLALWGGISILILGVFYLYTPAIASRYMLDFMPAFVASILVLFLYLPIFSNTKKRRLPFSFGLTVWLCLEVLWTVYINQTKSYGRPWTTTYVDVKERLNAFQSSINVNQFETHGWNITNGDVRVVAAIFVNNPKFLELNVSPKENCQLQPEIIRAKIQTEFLKRESIEKTEHGWKILFHGPTRTDYQKGLQTAFLAFVPKEQLSITNVPWRLINIRWGHGTNDCKTCKKAQDP